MNGTKLDLKSLLAWLAVALFGAAAVAIIALHRGETINSFWFVAAAVCVYSLGYRFYSAFIAAKVLVLDATRATPAERFNDGRDFVPTNRWVVFGHHFAAIAGPGPLIGPTLAAQFGYLPGTLWILAGAVIGRLCAGFRDSVLFHPPRRAFVGPDGARRTGPHRRHGGVAGGDGDHDHPHRRAGLGGGQRDETQPLGDFDRGGDHPHRRARRAVHALHPPWPGVGGDGLSAWACCCSRWSAAAG